MTQISKALILFTFFIGCSSGNLLPNDFNFTLSDNEWCVIVNGCKGMGDYEENGRREFRFPKSGIVLADIKNLEITKDDKFFIEDKEFSPSGTDTNDYKLCYHMVSLNSGYNAHYLAKQRGLKVGKGMKEMQDFDLFFFRVNKKCEDPEINLDDYFDKVWVYLLKNDVRSIK
tara:strand:+ start:269 stop:784 length:516 start_codon:yes stop_codon:yes gene_type:complete